MVHAILLVYPALALLPLSVSLVTLKRRSLPPPVAAMLTTPGLILNAYILVHVTARVARAQDLLPLNA
jgi:hypothetical protein